MEKIEIEHTVYKKMEYELAFKNGFSYVLYSDDPELLAEPSVDYTNISSIGYYDGFAYGDYCVRTGQKYVIKPENLMANMDKCFSNSYEKHIAALREAEEKNPTK